VVVLGGEVGLVIAVDNVVEVVAVPLIKGTAPDCYINRLLQVFSHRDHKLQRL
jgi:hypothetical protein